MRGPIRSSVAALALTAIIGFARPAAAGQLLGTTVTSPGISFGVGSDLGRFNNSSAVIADPGIEFTYSDPSNRDTFNFSDDTLTVTDVTSDRAVTFSATFTNAAFQGLAVTPASAGFPGLVASISGSTLTVSSTLPVSTPQTRSATFTFTATATAVPEPGVIVLAASGLPVAFGWWLKRRSGAAIA